MKLSPKFTSNFIYAVALLHIIVFTYAAFSKLADYETFATQLGQSPLLSAFAGLISWSIPALEISIAILLMFNSTRFIALTASFTLMVMFTAYIFIILNYSDFIPCSCGGILEKMTWKQHLYFNLFFCFLAAVAIILSMEKLTVQNKTWKLKHKVLLLLLSTFFGSGSVYLLFLKSEQIIHQENNFIRRFPPHLYNKSGELKLKYTGYYFAGFSNDTIYLGNYAAPLTILAISTSLKKAKVHSITLDNYKLPFQAALVRVIVPYFFLTDGTIPSVFKGNTSDWHATHITGDSLKFTAFEPIDSITAAIRTRHPITKESLIGKLDLSKNATPPTTNDKLLEKQIDGVFDCDGMLRYNQNGQKLIYTYYYRNQFIIADKNLKVLYRNNTIDTNIVAKLKITTLSNGSRKIETPPLMVNRLSSIFDNQLFINSNLRGHFESKKMWKQSTIIDVYNYMEQTYSHSFYIHNLGKEKPQAMLATSQVVYFLFDHNLIAYKIDLKGRKTSNSNRN